MKILILNSILFTSEKGIIPQVSSIKDCMAYNLALAFYQSGHSVSLAAALDYIPIEEESYPFEIIFFRSNFPRFFPPSVLPLHFSMYNYLKSNRNKYDLILSSETFSFNSLFASLVIPNRTIIWQELGVHNRKMKKIPSKLWYNIVARFFMRKVLIVPRSPKAGRFLRQFHLNVSSTFIDHGVNASKFYPSDQKKKQFIIVSRFVPTKNIMSMLHIYKKFLDKYQLLDYKLYMAGDGPCLNKIKNYIVQHQLNSQVILLGRLPHEKLNDYLSHSSCMLCNSSYDLNMIVIGESIAVGTPVITNTVPYSHEWVLTEKLGIAKDLWNEDDMYDIIKNNAKYVTNCLNYRYHLTIEYVVNEFIKLSKSSLNSKN